MFGVASLLLSCTRPAAAPAPEPSAPEPVAPLPSPPNPTTPNAADVVAVRVLLATASTLSISATGDWRVTSATGPGANGNRSFGLVLKPGPSGSINASNPEGGVAIFTPPISFATSSDAAILLNQRRYRGSFTITVADSQLRVINRVGLEDYLRGVVPRELGVRGPNERAALEAQSVAARSYAVARLGNTARDYDLLSTVADQVYGGMSDENPLADAAIVATDGLVLMYGTRVVSAPFYSTCGGSSAAPDELWRSRNEPFLQRVSDQIPGSDRYYCDIAPRFRWERSWRGDSLTAIVERYLRSYSQVSAGPIGAVRTVSVDGRTPSGRVAAIVVKTDRGAYRVRGNDIRYVLRSPGGELLNSTYFSPEVVSAADGRLARLTVRGLGYGHGVGMCQWGAIGRARAGQDFRTILSTYFPGTTVARAN